MEIVTFFSMYTDAVTIEKVEKKNVKEEEERKRKKLKTPFPPAKRLFHSCSSHPVTSSKTKTIALELGVILGLGLRQLARDIS